MKVHRVSVNQLCLLQLASSCVSYQSCTQVRSSSSNLISSFKQVTPAQQSLMVDALGSRGFNLQQFQQASADIIRSCVVSTGSKKREYRARKMVVYGDNVPWLSLAGFLIRRKALKKQHIDVHVSYNQVFPLHNLRE